jgi:CBS domain-containing protein
MNTVASVILRKQLKPVTVEPGTSILDALHLMAENNIGSVVVMEGNAYKGILTERDYSRKVVLKGRNSAETKVEDIMTTDLPSIGKMDTIERCMQLMSEKNIRYMPVMENDKLIGIISMSDVVKETIMAQKETIIALESYIHNV